MAPNDNPDIIGFLDCEGRRITNEMWHYLLDRNDGTEHTGHGEALYVKDITQWHSIKILWGKKKHNGILLGEKHGR